jgi:hypothetical protein
MRIVAIVSLRGAPGVSTTSIMVASTFADGLVVEADLDGGILAARYGLGREPGLTTLAADPHAGGGWRAHAQDAGGVPVLVGPDAPAAAMSLWHTAGERLTETLLAANGTAVVDAGRMRRPGPLMAIADLCVVMVRPIAEELVTLTHALPGLLSVVHGPVGVVLAGAGPYRPDDIECALDIDVVGVLPEDPGTVDALQRGFASGARIGRSRLGRAIAGLADAVHDRLTQPAELTTP